MINHKLSINSKLLFLSLFVALLTTSSAQTLSPGAKQLLEKIDFPPYKLEFPKVERSPLKNSVTLYSIPKKNPDPIHKIKIIFPYGENREAKNEVGSLNMLGQWLLESGTRNLSYIEFQEKLQQLGAQLNIDVGYDYWDITLSFLASSREQSLHLLSELLLYPNLKKETLVSLKIKTKANIKEQFSSPIKIARYAIKNQLYPKSRFSRTTTTTDIDRLSSELLQNTRKKFITTKNLAILTDIPVIDTKLVSTLEKFVQELKQIQKGNQSKVKVEKLKMSRKAAHIVYVSHAATAQAVIVLGTKLPSLRNPEMYSLHIANSILGGQSFTSRFMQKIRDQYGLAYFAGSRMRYLTNQSLWLAAVGTRPDKLADVLTIMMNEINSLNNITVEELQQNQNALIQRLILQYTNVSATILRNYWIDRFGLPTDYAQQYSKNIQQVTTTQIFTTTQRWLNKQRLFIAMVGPPQDFQSIKQKFGASVKLVDFQEIYNQHIHSP